MSGLRRPIRSESQPEKTFEIDAVASATPSITPTTVTLAPSVTVRNKGSSAWIVSDDRSMNRLTKPSAHTVRGIAGFAMSLDYSSLILLPGLGGGGEPCEAWWRAPFNLRSPSTAFPAV